MSATVKVSQDGRCIVSIENFTYIKDAISWLLLRGFVTDGGNMWLNSLERKTAELTKQNVDPA